MNEYEIEKMCLTIFLFSIILCKKKNIMNLDYGELKTSGAILVLITIISGILSIYSLINLCISIKDIIL